MYSIFNEINSATFLESKYGLSRNIANVLCLLGNKKHLGYRNFIIYNGDQINFCTFDKHSIDQHSVAYKIDNIVSILKVEDNLYIFGSRQKIKILTILLLDCIRQIVSFYVFHTSRASIVKLYVILTLLFICGFFQNIRCTIVNLCKKKIANIIMMTLSNNKKNNTKFNNNSYEHISPLEIIKIERLKKHAKSNIMLYNK